MNMKKTIAAVSAAVMAVSAMATVISANDVTYNSDNASHSITYSLVKEQDGDILNGTVKLSSIKPSGSGEATAVIKVPEIYLPSEGTGVTVRFIGSYNDSPVDIVYQSDIESNNYSATVKNILPVYDAETETYTEAVGFTPEVFSDFTLFAGYIEISFEHDYETKSDFNTATVGAKLEIAEGAEAMINLAELKEPSAGDKIKTPYKSVINTGNSATEDIMQVLKANGYVNSKAVINDIIANFDDVKITFNTAAEKVLDDVYSDSDDAKDYSKFNQGTFNLFGDEDTGNVGIPGFDWANSNLHNAAIIVNNQYTMAYSQIVPFVVDGKALTFDMNNFNEDYETSAFAQYIQNLQLATTTDWYWDNMVISYANSDDADVGAGEGLEDNDETLPDEDIVTQPEEIIPDENKDDIVVEPTSPSTGDAGLALAVIPVALAAAAVVMKKRK